MRRDIAEALLACSADPAGGRLAALFRFGESRQVFAAHFPGRPLLPGVMQIELVRYAYEVALNVNTRLVEVTAAKFLQPIEPGQRIALQAQLREAEAATRVKAVLRIAGREAATVTVVLAPCDDAA